MLCCLLDTQTLHTLSTSHVQATDTWYVAFVNTAADESSKMLTSTYSIAEVAYFRALVRRHPVLALLSPCTGFPPTTTYAIQQQYQ
jgi:hypothetical protein